MFSVSSDTSVQSDASDWAPAVAMWVIIGAVAALLAAVLYYLFSHKTEAAPDFAGGGAVTVSASSLSRESKTEEDDSSKPPITFYFGSQTGTADAFAKTLASESRRAGFKPAVVDLEEFDPEEFTTAAADGPLAVFVMATYGEGEPTDNAHDFYTWLRDKEGQLEEGCLQGLKYTVFGLGNRQYEHYNKMGRVTNKRLKALGGTEVFPSGEGDDDGTLDEDFAAWKENMWGPLQEVRNRSRRPGLASLRRTRLTCTRVFPVHRPRASLVLVLVPAPALARVGCSNSTSWSGTSSSLPPHRRLRRWSGRVRRCCRAR